MVKRNKIAKERLDKYYWQAKDQGYRSRAAFKLIQIDRKFEFLGNSQRVVDLCSAPGGWLQVCKKLLPVSSQLVGVDLVPIKPIPGATTFQSDIKSPQCKSQLVKFFGNKKADLVLHDGAPSAIGYAEKDNYVQNELVLHALKLAGSLLRPNGVFVTKVFRSVDYPSLLDAFRHFFKSVSVTKPHSSKISSAEIFVVCQKFDARNFDPKSPLLNPNHLFKEKAEKSLEYNVLRNNPVKRHRSGYEQDLITGNSIALFQFLNSEKPNTFLSSIKKIQIDAESEKFCQSLGAEVPEEIKRLCGDLQILNKSDFKALIKWQKSVKKLMPPTDSGIENADGAEGVDEDDEENDKNGEKDKNEMENEGDDEILKKLEIKKKQERRKKHKEKMRSLKRLRSFGDKTVFETDCELFTAQEGIITEKFKKAEEKLLPQIEDSEEERISRILSNGKNKSRDKFLQEQEEIFEKLHTETKNDKDNPKKSKKTPKKAESDDKTLISADPLNLEGSEWLNKGISEEYKDFFKGHDCAELYSDLSYKKLKKIKNKTRRDARERRLLHQAEKNIGKGGKELKTLLANKNRAAAPKNGPSRREAVAAEKGGEADNNDAVEFEVVCASADEEGESSEMSNDSEAVAETLAIAKAMLNKPRRQKIIDGSFNRNMFLDHGELPSWFADEEKKNFQRNLPVTKEEIDAFRIKKKDKKKIDHKETEGKAKKLKRKRKDFEKIKTKMETVMSSKDQSEKSKFREVEQLRRRYTKRNDRKVVYKVSRKDRSRASTVSGRLPKAGKKSKGGKVKMVDKRMKADKRALKKGKTHKKGRKTGRKGNKQ